MHEETIVYDCNGIKFKGFLVYDDTVKEKKPGVIVAHAWKGLDDFAKEKARALAKMGYVGFAADVYGNGIKVETDEEAQALMLPLFVDRQTLRDRIESAFKTFCKFEFVNPERIGAIGFCFGGLTVIELLRSGAAVKGIVTFHGVLGNKMGEMKAQTVPNADKLKGAILLLHGHQDPLVSANDIAEIQNELTKAQVDWQMDIYGHVKHAFTNPQAHDEKNGLVFNEKANQRSWQSMRNFFNELL